MSISSYGNIIFFKVWLRYL